jgi:myosin protein heavy chain
LTCSQVRPLLTATRNDEELRRKEAELALARVQAERDQQEREKLEKLRSELEQDRLRIQEDLEAERALNFDKDALLERSKKRESDLEEDVIALQQDLDTLDSQLDRVMETSKASEVKYATLKEAFDKAAEHLTLLEAEQQQWRQREGELRDDVQKAMREQEVSEKQKEETNRHAAELKLLVSQKDQDLRRLKERSDKTIESLDAKLATESRLR